MRHLFAACELGEDKLYRHIKPRKNRSRFLEFCRYLRSLYPPEVRIARPSFRLADLAAELRERPPLWTRSRGMSWLSMYRRFLTLHADPPTPAAGDESGAAAGAPGPIPVPQPIPPVVIQDVKFVPGTTSANTGSGGAVVPLPEVARQQWSFVPVGSGAGPDLFAVQSRAAAGMVLQPTDPTKPGPVVLRTVPLGTPLATFAWKVTSPALTS